MSKHLFMISDIMLNIILKRAGIWPSVTGSLITRAIYHHFNKSTFTNVHILSKF